MTIVARDSGAEKSSNLEGVSAKASFNLAWSCVACSDNILDFRWQHCHGYADPRHLLDQDWDQLLYSPEMPFLRDLPDEILLEVVRGLETIRSFDTQSVAFKQKGTEKGRQRENHFRQRALHALCLTSHRLRCLSLPTLYASSTSCATPAGLKKLLSFYRTISNPSNAMGQSKRLAEHVQYVENRLADHFGNSLQDDELFQQKSVSSYFKLLSKIVLCAPNLSNLCVVSLEYDDISFWNHLAPRLYPSKYHVGHTKLKHVSIQIHSQMPYPNSESSLFEGISLSLQSFTMLSELRISGATTNRASNVAHSLGTLPNLLRLDLTECELEMYEVAWLLRACTNVRQFTCKWAYLPGAYYGPPEIHAALLTLASTLETLTLDARDYRYFANDGTEPKLLESLRPLKVLKHLTICESGFLSSNLSLLDFPDQTLDCEISTLLPENLEHMTLLMKGDFESYDEDVLDDAYPLLQLVQNCRQELRHLKTLCIESRHDLTAPNLTAEFERVGVLFNIERED